MPTVAKFMPVFFGQPRTDGRIDRAVGTAQLRHPPRPVAAIRGCRYCSAGPRVQCLVELGLLLGGGCRRVPRLVGAAQAQSRGGIAPLCSGRDCSRISSARPRQIARTWSRNDKNNPFPLAPHGRNGLTQVNQFFSRLMGQRLPYDMLRKHQFDRIEGEVPGPAPPPAAKTPGSTDSTGSCPPWGITGGKPTPRKPHRSWRACPSRCS